jgi:hypothetical protein
VDYRAETELGLLCRELLNDLERFRPGLNAGATEAEIVQAVEQRVALRFEELYREHSDGEPESAAMNQLELYRREIGQIFVPRYTVLARADHVATHLQKRSLGGAEPFNRVAYTTFFFTLGLFVVWAPFIPIWEKWVPFALGGLAAFFAPALPDLEAIVRRRRHNFALLRLLVDIDQAGRALPVQYSPKAIKASAVTPHLTGSSEPASEDQDAAAGGHHSPQ